MSLAALNIDQFKNRFFLEECPFWFAYQTTSKGELVGRFRDDEPEASKEDKMEWSWMKFEDLVDTHSYGRLKVVCKSSANANVTNAPTFMVEWGEVPSRRGARSVSSTNGQWGGSNNGGGNWAMMQFFLAEQSRQTRELQDAKMEAMRLNFENRNLAEILEAENEPDLKEHLIKEVVSIGKTWVASQNMRQPAALGTMGQREPAKELPESNKEAVEAPQDNTFSIDGAMKYIRAITDLFPEHDRMSILHAFYNLALQNKELIAVQLQTIIQQNEQ